MAFLDYLAFFILIWILMNLLTPVGGVTITVIILVIWGLWPKRRTEIVYVHPGRTFLA